MEENIVQLQLCLTCTSMLTPRLCCFIKAQRRKAPALGGTQDEQPTGQKKEENPQPTAQQEEAHWNWDHKGESGADWTLRMLFRKMIFEMNVGEGWTAKVKQQQWKPCR